AMALKSALGIYFKDMNTEQVYDAYRGAELSSAQGSKPATMSAIMSKVDALTKIVVGTGGKVDYSQLHSFMRMNKNLRTTMAIEARGSKVRDVRIKDLALLMSDPAKWGATTFTTSLAARGVNVNDNASVMKAIGPMTGNQNLAQVLSMLVTQRGAIAKDRDIV